MSSRLKFTLFRLLSRCVVYGLVACGVCISGLSHAQNPSEKDMDEQKSLIDPSTGMIPTDKAIEMLKSRVERNDKDWFSMTLLGQIYMRDAKERDDHTSYERAEEAFRAAIKVDPAATKAAQVHLIGALQSQHKFKQALAQSDVALNVVPGNLVAIAAKGDAQLELGDLAAAEKSFQTVYEQAQTPGVLARMTRLKELQGDTSAAIDFAEQAQQKSIAVDEPASSTAWYDWRLGLMHFGTGNLKSAEEAFNTGIVRNANDTKCLDGLAEVLTAQGKLELAEKLYLRSLDLEEAPPTIAKFGDLLMLLNRPDEAKKKWDRCDVLMRQEALTTGVAHYRERALFLLAHDRDLELALELAEKDLEHRSDIYTYDALAWAQYKNKRFDDAYKTLSHLKDAKVQDAGLMFRMGMIAAQSGHAEEAIERLTAALKTNPYFDVTLAKEAKAQLEELKKGPAKVSASR